MYKRQIENVPNALLEVRTKSTQIRSLLKRTATSRCVIAYSLAPEAVAKNFEHGAANIAERIASLSTLQAHGWPVGVRLDPLIYFTDFKQAYASLVSQVNDALDIDKLHSVTIGPCRMPKHYAKKIQSLYPNDPLIASLNSDDAATVTYDGSVRAELQDFVYGILEDYIDPQKIHLQFDNDEQAP